MKHFHYLTSILGLAHSTYAAMLTLDCTTFPESCNNDCYGIFSAGLPSSLTWDMPTTAVEKQRRRGSGCTNTNSYSVCSSTKGVAPWNQDGPSCDEYPYASTSQGGMAGASLRCMSQSDNSKEGRFLQKNLYNVPIANGGCGNAPPCQFTVMFDMNTLGNSPLCMNTPAANDGHEFKLVTKGNYANAKRDGDSDDFYAPHLPVNGTFPMHLRREFVLSNGKHVMLGSTDLEVDIIDTIVATSSGSAHIVQELFGHQKSKPLRPQVGSAHRFMA
ncbi:hypothetical protein D6D13_10639 [Aureobasidium pullulans]|uniref:Deoxyribonuclease NucA/NucB domain-containing protein n=1 Tax=Aureobasidium pullulans TaxID=5580 RepID=A0A4S9BWR5_AURPU|nr:hypothetical protein D6D13_10639 [Aureobasidium pullulans]